MKTNVLILLFLGISLPLLAQQTNQVDWQQRVDYSIDVSLDDTLHTLTGVARITYYNNSPNTLSKLYMHLWPNGYANNETAFGRQMQENGDLDFFYAKEDERGNMTDVSFTVGDTALNWTYATLYRSKRERYLEQHLDVAEVLLSEPLLSGQKITVVVTFMVKLPKVYSRLGHKDQDYFITQWYPKPAVYDVNGWNPMPYLNMGEFYSEFGSFEVNVTLPEDYTLVATGECLTSGELAATEKKGNPTADSPSSTVMKTVRFKAENVHDFAWFASKRWGYVSREIEIAGEPVKMMMVGAEPDKQVLDYIETALTYYSEHVGPYPYSHATVVHGELKAGGGMEYPMITLCDMINEEVVVHEVGHNWFYGILGTDERTYPWMDESINSYFEGEAMGAGDKASKVNAGIMLALVKDNLLRNEHQAISGHSVDFTELNYGASVYGLGAEAFGYLKAYLGDELFKKCFTSYYNDWKYKHPLPGDMQASFETTSEQDLSWFFEEVLGADKKLDYKIKKQATGFQLVNKGEVEAPVPLYFMYQDSVLSKKWYSVPVGESLLLDQPHGDTLVAHIDRENETIDLFRGNNITKKKTRIRFGFGLIDRADIRKIYAVPTLGWNYYDRLMLGVGVHNYSAGNKAVHYHLMPMYSFENKTVNGEAAINYNQPLKGMAQYLEVGAKARKYTFNNASNFGREYSYLKLAPYLQYHFPKKTQRSPVTKSICLRYDFITLTPREEIYRGDAFSDPRQRDLFDKNRQFITAEYKIINKRAINGYEWIVEGQVGQITLGETQPDLSMPRQVDSTNSIVYPYLKDSLYSENLARISSTFKYNLDIGIQNKPLELRFFGSYVFATPSATIYKNVVGSRNNAAYYDYAMDDYLLHRNPEEGLFQNQISNRRDFSKFVGPIGSNNASWLVTASATVPLPGKIPIKPYVEVLMYEDISEMNWNVSGSSFVFNVGIELEVIPDRFEIFFNLAQSNDVTQYQEGTVGGLVYPNTVTSFAERITFVLDLNGLTPQRLKKNANLF